MGKNDSFLSVKQTAEIHELIEGLTKKLLCLDRLGNLLQLKTTKW